ncbi:hypothetical protein BBK36DRAFT_1202954 [Trichoderma citrinoviride]|uniref:DUF6546 domain-containing protein n=1 Tax=Trichoderma citrinoviride TaxID=58853 RepID=A0A2T4B971_9HYPO|nr:hypothetical protein BBK36DRAFT_1202954 [Trichoderma citrinoviride]PTB65860.1 hypothetical protein BBK36DRAFT_1202954 [Trichoderma citrinoviride]
MKSSVLLSCIAFAASVAAAPVPVYFFCPSLPCSKVSLVALPVSERRYDGPGSQKLAQFATVCREWQVFFETYTFRRLVLDSDSLGEFDAIIRRRDACLGNNLLFTTCIHSLLRTLKLWDPAIHGAKGLTLMLSASSPSDTEHRFGRCEMKDNYPFHYAEDLDLAPGLIQFHRANVADPYIYVFHGDCGPPSHNGHAQRLRGTPLRLIQRGDRGSFVNMEKSLPGVPMVKGLVRRRQFRREIQVGALSWLLTRSFVALEWFRFERTVYQEPQQQLSFEQESDEVNNLLSGVQSRLLPSLPRTLRQLSFTQWKIPIIERGFGLEQVGSEIPPHARAQLPREMAKLSQRLEQFCPPWQMDTAAFFHSIIELGDSSAMLQSSLKRIILRCPLSNTGTSGQDFGSMVLFAAKAALSLPHLEVIELWGICLDEHGSHAYIFQYAYEDSRASIVWRSSEKPMVSQARIIAKWDEVAQKHSHSALTYSFVPFVETEAEVRRSGGLCVIRYLRLEYLLVDPITRKALEHHSLQWGPDDKSDSLQQDDPPNPSLAHPNSLGGPALDADLSSLQAEMTAFGAKVKAFLQQNKRFLWTGI